MAPRAALPSEVSILLTSVSLDGRPLSYDHAVLIASLSGVTAEWSVILLGVSPADLARLQSRRRRVALAVEDGWFLGEVCAQTDLANGYVQLTGYGPLRQLSRSCSSA
jgi:hypothetical protein